MSLEEHDLDPMLEEHCEVCGATLTDAEIQVARDANGPYLCTVHASETLPVEPDDADATEDEAGA
jgi:hypothetical protein